MKSTRPSVLKGFVRASGFFFPDTLARKGHIFKRIMNLWRPGCKIYRSEIGYILILSQSRLVDSRLFAGRPAGETGKYPHLRGFSRLRKSGP